MSATPKDRGVVPPGGLCHYQDPDDGWSFSHPYYDHVKTTAWKHRREHALPIPADWDSFFDAQFCRATPQACVEVPAPPAERAPTLVQMATQFTRSMTNWAMSGFRVTSWEEYKARQLQCAGDAATNAPRCPYFASWAGFALSRCEKCGCSAGVKLWLATERCPIGKWDPV